MELLKHPLYAQPERGPSLTCLQLCPIWHFHPPRLFLLYLQPLFILVDTFLSTSRWSQVFPTDTVRKTNKTVLLSPSPSLCCIVDGCGHFFPELHLESYCRQSLPTSPAGSYRNPWILVCLASLQLGFSKVTKVPPTRCTSLWGWCSWRQWLQVPETAGVCVCRGFLVDRSVPGEPSGGSSDVFSGVFTMALDVVPLC